MGAIVLSTYKVLLRVLIRLVLILLLLATAISLCKFILGEWGFR